MKNNILLVIMALCFFGAAKRIALGGAAADAQANMDTIMVELILGSLCGAAVWINKRSERASNPDEDA